MKVTVQDGNLFYVADFTLNDKIEDGFVHEYYAEPKEVVDVVIHLLGCAYGEEKIEDALRERYEQETYNN